MAQDLDLSDCREGPQKAIISSMEIKQGRKIRQPMGKLTKKEVKIPEDLLDDD